MRVSVEENNLYPKKEVVARLFDLYVNYTERYLMSLPAVGLFVPKKGKEGNRTFLPLTESSMFGHLNRHYALGVFANKDSSKFITFDVDINDTCVCCRIIEAIVSFGIPRQYIHVSTSGGKGFHVEIFFDEPVPTFMLQRLYRAVIVDTEYNYRKVEFRPTSTQGIKLPLSVHYKTGNVAWFLDRDYNPIKTTDYVFEIVPYPAEWYMKLDIPIISSAVYTANIIRNEEADDSGKDMIVPSMIAHRIDYNGVGLPPPMTEAGTRHSMMVQIAARCKAGTVERCEGILTNWYHAQDPLLIATPEEEVMADIAKIASWAQKEGILKAESSPCINYYDTRLILNQRTKLGRKIMFYMLVRINDNPWGKRKEPLKSIAEFVGASVAGVDRCISEMIKDGSLKRSDKTRKVTMTERGLEAESHTYYLPAGNIKNMPNPTTKKDIERVEVRYQEMLDNFDDVFYGTLLTFYQSRTIRDYLTVAEYRLIRQKYYRYDTKD